MKRYKTQIIILSVIPVEMQEAMDKYGQVGLEFKAFVPNSGDKKVWIHGIFQKEISEEN